MHLPYQGQSCRHNVGLCDVRRSSDMSRSLAGSGCWDRAGVAEPTSMDITA